MKIQYKQIVPIITLVGPDIDIRRMYNVVM